MELSFSDIIVIVLYMLITLWIGLSFAKNSGKSMENYILGGRNLPWWVAGISMVATTFAADTPLAVTELVSTQGISGNWMWWNMLTGGMLTVFFFATLWRKANVLTEPELITLRYGGAPARFLRTFKSVYLGLFMNVVIMAWVNIAFMALLEVFFGFTFNEQLLWTGCVMLFTALYTALAGLKGVAYTDIFQFVVAMAGCILLAWLVLDAPTIKGMEGLVAQLPEASLNFFPEINTAATAGTQLSLGIGSFLVFTAMQWWASWYPGAEPGGGGYVAQRMMSTKTQKDSLYSVLLFQLTHYCLRPWPWIIVALACIVLYPELPADKARLGYVMAIRDYMPDGLRGLMLAAFLGAYMSTISTQLNWGAGYIVNDFLPGINAKWKMNSVLNTRVTVILLMIASIFITTFIQSVTSAWAFLLECGAGLGLVLILRWYWWRINIWSEIAATFAPFLFMSINAYLGIDDFPIRYSITLAGTTLTWLLVTMITKPESTEVLKAFYDRVQPQGAWKPFANHKDMRIHEPSLFLRCIAWISAVGLAYSFLFLSGKWILGIYQDVLPWLISVLVFGFILIRTIPKITDTGK
jgi:solute:Na+ symporter, SSS family